MTLSLMFQGFSVKHSFRIARVAQPLLGADFFRKHSIMIDVKENCLRLPGGVVVTSASQCKYRSCNATVSNPPVFSEILRQFPAITEHKFDPAHVPAHGVKHVVPTTGPPLFARARPLFADKLRAAKEEFDKMSMEIIWPSSSPWASPLHMVPKPNGSWRPCGDFRRLNDVTCDDRYPLPHIHSFGTTASGSKIF